MEAPKLPTLNPDSTPKVRTFVLQRVSDHSGISGTGVVAIGVRLPSGVCVMEWTTLVSSIGTYNSIADLEAIHGHEGKTKVVWVA